MKHLHRSILVLLTALLLLAPALPAMAAVDATPTGQLGWLEVLLARFFGLAPMEAASVEASSEVSAEDPAGSTEPTASDPFTTSVPEDSSDTESGHLIDPDG